MTDLKKTLAAYIDENLPVYKEMALQIHAKPEVSNYEFFACETLSNHLKSLGFEVELNAAGHRTGFAASYDSKKPGPTVAFLAEFDALTGLGHGCGHNLYGCQSSLAGAALKQIADEIGGQVRVYGTPGEEGGEQGSSKGSFVREGYFKDVDFAIGVHPGSGKEHGLTSKNLGCVPIDIEFWGVSSHAAGAPEKGINALDAMILTFNGISMLRQQLTSDVRIHGVITNGGKAPNSIPDYTAAKFYLRAAAKSTLEDVYKKVENIVQGSALQTGCTCKMAPYQNWVDNMVPTPGFDEVFAENLQLLGESVKPWDGKLGGSSDVGNVSQVIPTIQPHISIVDEAIKGHSLEMVAASCSEKGLNAMALAAKAMAFTALDLFQDPQRLEKIKEEHAYNVAHQAL